MGVARPNKGDNDMKKILIIVLAVLGVLGITFGIMTASEYNTLFRRQENVAYNKSQIVNSLQTRDSTLNQLAAAVDAAVGLDVAVYTMITNARSALSTAVADDDYTAIIEADVLSSLAISELYAVIEDNPDVQSMEVIVGFMATIESLENALKVSRTDYNTAVATYNTAVGTFPHNLFAKMFKYADRLPYWAADTESGSGEITISTPAGLARNGA